MGLRFLFLHVTMIEVMLRSVSSNPHPEPNMANKYSISLENLAVKPRITQVCLGLILVSAENELSLFCTTTIFPINAPLDASQFNLAQQVSQITAI